MKRPLRVLWFVNKPLPAVCERLGLAPMHRGGWLEALELAFRDSGAELAVACNVDSAQAPFAANGTTYYTIAPQWPPRTRRLLAAWEARAYLSRDPRLYDKAVTDFRPDVIHVHGTEGSFGLRIPAWTTPSVMSIQGVLSSCAVLDGRGRDRDAWLSLSPGLLLKNTGMAGAGGRLRRLARRERTIVGNCFNFMGRTRFDHDVLAALKSDFRYFHCDEILRPPFFAAEWCPHAGGPIVIACGGGDYARKGLGTAVESLALLRAASGLDARLHVLGDVPHPESSSALERRARRHGVARFVSVTGALTGAQTAHHLAASDVYVHPSHADNSPNSVCEAMLVGTPIVASSAGGVSSLAADGIEALLVQDGDPFALAGALRTLITDHALAAELSRNARARACRRHAPSSVVAQLLDAYESVRASGGVDA